jgi:type I restriction enzyme S subunit
MSTNQGFKNIIPKLIDSEFLYYKIQSEESGLLRIACGSTFLEVSKTDFDNFQIAVPPLPEQTAIANCLSTWDKAIATQNQLIAQKELRKKALMQQLLSGKKRLKGFSGEWKEVSIKNIGKVVSGGTPSTDNQDYWNGNINWCTPTDITKLNGEVYIGETVRKISELGFKNSSAKLLPINSIIVCTRATVGAIAINKVPMTTNQGFKSITVKNNHYLFMYYKMLTLRNELISVASGSTFLEVSKSDFDNIQFKIPSIKEQTAIANILQGADEEIQILKKKLQQLKDQKKGLMQVLLTGKQRLEY